MGRGGVAVRPGRRGTAWVRPGLLLMKFTLLRHVVLVLAAGLWVGAAGCSDQESPSNPKQTTTAPAEQSRKPDADPATQPADAAQGIHGRVVKVADAFDDPMGGGDPQPHPVPVHVFRGRVQPFEKPNPDHPALLKIVQPDQDGRFDLALPPGEYTLVLDLNGRLYINNWLADGSWATATVREGQWTDYVIEDVLETE